MNNKLKLLATLLAALMLTTACAKSGDDDVTTDGSITTESPDTNATGDTISGEPLALLETIVTDAKIELAIDTAEMTADISQYTVGLTADDMADVESAAISQAMMTSQAHMVALLKCKDADAAQTIKQKLHDQFDVRRWVCVLPDKCYVIESGSYVFFVATMEDYADPLFDAFKTQAGENIGERLDLTVS